ncbi:probable protein phosphatase 2C 51 isoform X2 [Tanacetum coccineum]
MGKFKIVLLAASVLLLCVCTNTTYVFKDFQAAIETVQCRGHWGLEVESIKKSIQECPFVSVQGRKNHQEDRVICNLNMWFPLLEKYRKNAAKVDLFAVFDGHGGAEASETVKQQLVDRFLNYVVMDAFHKASDSDNQDDVYLTKEGYEKLPVETIAKMTLVVPVKWLFVKPFNAGSTASVVLVLNNEELLAANVGNSRVILCAEFAEELTTYHNHSDAPRVKGKLAVSRVIGDAKSIKIDLGQTTS